MGTMPESGMFNQAQIQEAYTFVNAMTRNDRNHIGRVFKRIMPFWKDQVTISTYEIIPQKYFDGATAAPTGTPAPGTPGTQPAPGAAPATAVERVKDDKLTNLNAAESANMERIIRKVNKKKMTREAGAALLKMSYGFTDEEVKMFLP
jgi:hypothetical protein